ncbi:FG-GAP repeat domain-containing protein [Herbidospora mongoliensis]|uniref:FG-GAP repeat domain-containing protein n=1 Tax=Herbidospora mongoliensis TaxID=688067 RepID=UPI00082A9129|nr:VCBS repeat-containing protein [Herbidospora mongoliensis]
MLRIPRLVSAGLVIVAMVVTGTPALADSSPGGQITRSEVLSRAQNWVDRGVKYNQSRAPSTLYTDVEGDNEYGPDCSGLVSMAWHITANSGKGGHSTDNFESWSGKIFLASLHDLKPGDAILKNGHMELFARWKNAGDHSQGAWTYSLNGTGDPDGNGWEMDWAKGPAVNSHGRRGDESWSSLQDYRPIRYKNIVDDPPPATPRARPGDFDGDGRSDRALWDPSTGKWFVEFSATGVHHETAPWGQAGDVPVPGDYNGDGQADRALWRPSTGVWYVTYSTTGQQVQLPSWGVSGHVPVPGDYDGDGRADRALWDQSNGKWFVEFSNTGTQHETAPWGQTGDIPVPGDYNGDGQADRALWRPSTGVWYITYSGSGQQAQLPSWGVSGHVPVPGDFDGDGRSDRTLWDPSNGKWFVEFSATGTQHETAPWGQAGDVPVPGDYNGDGQADRVVWRPSTGVWYATYSSTGQQVQLPSWGVSGQIPVT